MIRPDPASEPFFGARVSPAGVDARGAPSRRLGTRLDLPGRQQPDGIFAEWDWDGHRLVVRNDRFGFYPLFYFALDGEIGISPSIPKLLLEGAPTELDEAALAVFLRIGFFLGEATPFRAIRALPPNATLEWRDGRLRLSGGFRLASPRSLSRDAAIEAYAALFRQAIARRRPSGDEVVLPLSGGRDSRHILFELGASGRRPSLSLTHRHNPPRTDEDAEVAARVAAAVGLPHFVLDQTESRLQSELRKNLRTSFCLDEGPQFLVVGDFLADRPGQVTVFDGLGGDVLSAGLFLDSARLALFEAGRLRELAERLLAWETRVVWLLDRAQRRRFSRELAVETLTRELERHVDAPNPVGSFYFWNRTRREVALVPHGLYPGGVELFFPYLDHDLYDLLAALPARDLLDRRLHTATILQTYSRYAKLPFEVPERLFRYDARARDYLRATIRDLFAYLDEAPSELVWKTYVKQRLLGCYRAGRELNHYTDHVVYLLQLERLIAGDRG